MASVINLVQSIPDVIWSGVIASVLTLSGVLISNRSSTYRLRIQLEHDAQEKAKERTAALRRDVYLLTVEELSRANSYLASLPQADFTKANASDGFQGFARAAAKLQLVAEPDTTLLVNNLVAEFGKLFLKLLPSVLTMQQVRNDITLSDTFYTNAQSEVTRILSQMAMFNEAARTDQHVFAALERAFANYQAQATKYSDERTTGWKEFNALHVSFCRKVFSEMESIGEHEIPAIVAIRRDLGLLTNIEELRNQMIKNWKDLTAQTELLLESLQDG